MKRLRRATKRPILRIRSIRTHSALRTTTILFMVFRSPHITQGARHLSQQGFTTRRTTRLHNNMFPSVPQITHRQRQDIQNHRSRLSTQARCTLRFTRRFRIPFCIFSRLGQSRRIRAIIYRKRQQGYHLPRFSIQRLHQFKHKNRFISNSRAPNTKHRSLSTMANPHTCLRRITTSTLHHNVMNRRQALRCRVIKDFTQGPFHNHCLNRCSLVFVPYSSAIATPHLDDVPDRHLGAFLLIYIDQFASSKTLSSFDNEGPPLSQADYDGASTRSFAYTGPSY